MCVISTSRDFNYVMFLRYNLKLLRHCNLLFEYGAMASYRICNYVHDVFLQKMNVQFKFFPLSYRHETERYILTYTSRSHHVVLLYSTKIPYTENSSTTLQCHSDFRHSHVRNVYIIGGRLLRITNVGWLLLACIPFYVSRTSVS